MWICQRLSLLLTGWQWAIKANYGSGRQSWWESESQTDSGDVFERGTAESESALLLRRRRRRSSEESTGLDCTAVKRRGRERAILNRDTFPLSPSPSPSRSLVAAPQSRAEERESTITAECRTRIGWRKKEKNEVTARRLHSIRQRTSEMNQIGGDIRKAQRLISLKGSKKLKCRLVNRILVQLLTF